MSIFLEMAKVIEEEHIAGRITLAEAKSRLVINMEVALGLELSKNVKSFAHTSEDWERDRYLDYEAICCW